MVAELTIDQKLAWLDEGAWEWRFPTVAMPRYLGDRARGGCRRASASTSPMRRCRGARGCRCVIRDRVVEGRRAESPSHALAVGGDGVVALADDGGARLDRDLVVRWPVAAATPGVTVDVGRPADGKPHAAAAYGLVTLVPPARGAGRPALARDLCLLVDTSGSMAGEPLAQACRVMEALVDTLGDDDTLEMIEFSDAPRRWKRKPVRMVAAERAGARTSGCVGCAPAARRRCGRR